MISVLLYGRNDSHGYNLHKRTAMSVNAIAELLADPDDEIVFVDYNTPDDLPTLIEAIYDTLTERAKSVLKLYRIGPAFHSRLFTHLVVIEPQPRNIGARLSSPRNRWLLSTNSDMIFVPREGYTSFNSAFEDLPDGLYLLPRFDLPETLWESLPRNDAKEILRACGELGSELHLDEVTRTHSYSRFDQVGDFQLIPRQALWDVHGFDERMIHGWHVDSNMAKRLWLYYGKTDSLETRLKGYHCNHTRVATFMHGLHAKLDNDVWQYVFNMEDAYARHQADTWGLPDVPVQPVDLVNGPQGRCVEALKRTLGGPQKAYYESSAIDLHNYVFYNQEHVLPHLATNFTMCAPGVRIAYAGNNPLMLRLASRCLGEMGFREPIHYVEKLLTGGAAPEITKPIRSADVEESLLSDYDLVIFDFGLDRTGLNLGTVSRVTDWPRELRYSLGAVARCLEACGVKANQKKRKLPEFLVINANHHVFRRLVEQTVLAVDTPFATHLRKGLPRLGNQRPYRGHVWKQAENLMRSYFGYTIDDWSPHSVRPGQTIDFTSAGEPAYYKDGHWGAMDYEGTWTDGERATVVFSPADIGDVDWVADFRINETFLGADFDPIRVVASLNGKPLAKWKFFTVNGVVDARVTLPRDLLASHPVARLELHVENPQSAEQVARSRGQLVIGEDPRMLGIRVQRVAFRTIDSLRCAVGDKLDFTEKGTGALVTDECWSLPDDLGMWTVGPKSSLTLRPDLPPNARLVATFGINDCAVSDVHQQRQVAVSVNGVDVANWTLGPVRNVGPKRILLPAGVCVPGQPMVFTFRCSDLKSPKELGWSTWDRRPLALRLESFTLAPAGPLKYSVGGLIDMTEGGNSIAFAEESMGCEWAPPGPLGCWTMGPSASLRIDMEAPPGRDLPASFLITDCVVSPSQALDVLVKANGREIGRWKLDDRKQHRRTVQVPAVAMASGVLLLSFEMASPRSPQSLGWSSDDRPLGFQLASAAVGREDVEMPVHSNAPPKRSMIRRIIGLPQFALHVARILIARYRHDG